MSEPKTSPKTLELIAALRAALSKHEWSLYEKIEGTITSCCACGARVRTMSAWFEHLKDDVLPEAVRAAIPGHLD
jgi:hypothetical protein